MTGMGEHNRTPSGARSGARLGTRGYLFVFLWLMIVTMIAPAARLPWVATCAIMVTIAVFRIDPRRLLGWRRLVLFALLLVPPMFFFGELDRSLFGIPYSSEGLSVSFAIFLRMLVFLSAAQGLASVVDCTAMAGSLERLGLHGLGFALGVAFNMLPSLEMSSRNMWRALRMRGGLRRQWPKGLRLLTVTVLVSALRHAEEVAIAAEARAFSPDQARPLPITAGRFDRWAVAAGPLALALVLIPW